MRQRIEGMKEPEARALLEELSMLQYERGHTHGAEEAAMPALDAALQESRKGALRLRNRKRPEPRE